MWRNAPAKNKGERCENVVVAARFAHSHFIKFASLSNSSSALPDRSCVATSCTTSVISLFGHTDAYLDRDWCPFQHAPTQWRETSHLSNIIFFRTCKPLRMRRVRFPCPFPGRRTTVQSRGTRQRSPGGHERWQVLEEYMKPARNKDGRRACTTVFRANLLHTHTGFALTVAF